MGSMTSLPRLAAVPDLAPVETVEGVLCWSGELAADDRVVVSLVVEEPATADQLDLAFAAAVLDDLPELLVLAASAAAQVLDTELPDSDAPDDDPLAWDPEVTFFPGSEWAVRFADLPLPGAGELGVMVFFDGRAVQSVDDLRDVEQVEVEGDEHHDHGGPSTAASAR